MITCLSLPDIFFRATEVVITELITVSVVLEDDFDMSTLENT